MPEAVTNVILTASLIIDEIDEHYNIKMNFNNHDNVKTEFKIDEINCIDL